MRTMVTNVYAMSHYDRLRINKTLGTFGKLITTTTTIFVAIRDSSGSKNHKNIYYIYPLFDVGVPRN